MDVARNLCWGLTTEAPKRQDRDAGGVKGEGYGKGDTCPLPSLLGDLGSVISSPSRAQGGAPAKKRALEHLELQKTHLMATNPSCELM